MANNIIDKIQISGQSYDVKDSSAATVVELSQQEYDDLPSSAKTGNTLFVITDAIAIEATSAVTSGSTAVVTSGGVYEQVGGIKIVKLTESEYTALVTKDSDTLYVVVPDPSN